MSDQDVKSEIRIKLEIEPCDEDLLENKPTTGLETDSTCEGFQRVNPTTGELETVEDSSIEEAVYLDLNEKPKSVVKKGKRKKKLRKTKQVNRGQWRRTNAEEWMKVYQRYMARRARDLRPSPPRTNKKHYDVSDEKTDFSEMYTPYMICRSEQRNTSEANNTPIKTESLDKQESNGQEKLDSIPDSSGSEFEDVEFLETTQTAHMDRDKQKIIKKNMRILQNNSLKLLKHSNLCLFKCETEYLQCFNCQQQFKHMSMLRAHSRTNHNFKKIRRLIDSDNFHNADLTNLECNICNASVESLNELQNHLKIHEIKFKLDGSTLIPYKLCSGNFKCQCCHVELTSLCQLQRHMKRHVLRHFCVCGNGFSSSNSLKLHEIVCGRKKCNFCELTFADDGDRKRHEREKHNVVLKIASFRFKCSYCRQQFRHNYLRQQHIIEQHRRGGDLFQCGFCAKTFVTSHWCSKHMHRVHAHQLYENT